jgi:protein-disulfide isomerase
LPLNETSALLAKSAFCAGEQGKFWPYHDRIFSDDKPTTESVAAELGLVGPTFQSCLTSQAAHDAVRKDAQEAKRLGIEGTPAFLVNGRLVNGFLSYDDFKSLIQEELKRVR